MSDSMSKEQKDFIDKIILLMLKGTNITENEAYDFAFRIWQMKSSLMDILVDKKVIDQKPIYQKAIKTFGTPIQIVVCMEEMAELIKELSKDLRNKGNIEHIAEEIADVMIMLEQMILIFNCDVEVKNYRLQKLERLKMLLEGEHND